MSAVIDKVIEETGLNLRDGTLIATVIAPRWAERLNKVIGDLERAEDIAKKIIGAYQGLSALKSTSVIGVYGAAINAIGDAYTWLQGQAQKAQNDSLVRREKTRSEFVKRYASPGSWSQVLFSKSAPSPKSLSLSRTPNWTEGGHLAQYDPYYCFHVSRVGRPSVLNPTWSTPPFDLPAMGPPDWENGVTYEKVSLLGGYTYWLGPLLPFFQDRPVAVPAVGGKYADKYWGNKPNGGSITAENPFDAAIFVQGYAPPPGYQYLFSWGTYPYTGWLGAPGGDPISPTFDLSAEAAALAAAIHSLSPVHARIPWDEVATAYQHFVAASGFRNLPPLPEGQVDLGLYLDHDLLPFSNSPGLPVLIGNSQSPTGYQIPWETIREIELLFRNWFALRRSAIYQFQFTSPNFKEVCKLAPEQGGTRDPLLRDLAKGKPPPPYVPWKEWDPLDEGWYPGQIPKPPKGKSLGDKSKGKLKGSKGKSDDGGIVVAAAGGAALWLLL